MPYADLHTHSSASDGTFDARQIIEIAAETPGLGVIAITDHDSVQLPFAEQFSHPGIELVNGVEITTRHDGRAVHMLGYFIDAEHAGLCQFLEENRERRRARTLAMADRLAEAGYPISSADLVNTGNCVNRPVLGRMLVERGCASNVDDAFSRLLGSKSPYYIDVAYPDTIEAMRLIREADGCAFIAHPARYRVTDLIPAFAREGMAGLEAYHTQQTREQTSQLLQFADELSLGVSGGSDWHGDDAHEGKLGGAGLDENGYHAFLQACGRA